jgi:hypothetical protein
MKFTRAGLVAGVIAGVLAAMVASDPARAQTPAEF